MKRGFWKTKEEACEVFSNSDIIGWRTTLEYYEGQVPHERKTEWVMQVFSMTRKSLCDDNEKKETSSLCRVFLVSSHEMHQKVSTAGIENETQNDLTQPPVLDANSSARIGSSSNPQVNMHNETEVLAVAERLPVQVPEHQVENLVEMDIFSRGQMDSFSSGDFLELQDLDSPASSSSSENSNAVGISWDECFDPMAFLQDLEDPILEKEDTGKRLNVSASNKSDEVVIVPATLGSVVSLKGSNSGSDEPSGSRNLNNKVTKHAKGNKRGEGPSSSSSSSHKPSTSSDSHSAAAGGETTAAFGVMKNLRKKYSCFMPF
ncbi:NAC domain-containing protein 79-like isoform X2 [Durio zibethinus]|nr:NAC domain-containing protein 79-like isoform X2 [Durio zibethinus]